MQLLPEIRNKGYLVREVWVVDRNGKRVAGFPVEVLSRAARGHFVSLPRGELAASIFGRIENRVETIFGDSVARIEQTGTGVRVAFEGGAERQFDLVVGADGLHSRVRELVFGPEAGFEKYLGYKVAAFETRGYRPRDELVYVMYTEVGQQVARFAMRDDRTMFLFTFADQDANGTLANDMQAQKKLLRERIINLLTIPWVADLSFTRDLKDELALPEY
jgi:2-polyprenyl-6-methoxyphenol hydroxylase-like FAD-dependent oxidoreductase